MNDLISRQAAIRRYCGEHCGCEPQDCGLTMLQDGSEDCDFVRFLKEEPSRDIAPSAQPEQRYTEEELRVFAHGISLSLLSKRSAQHWRYDKDTATEIEFLERLYDKVSANMKGRQG